MDIVISISLGAAYLLAAGSFLYVLLDANKKDFF